MWALRGEHSLKLARSARIPPNAIPTRSLTFIPIPRSRTVYKPDGQWEAMLPTNVLKTC